MDKVTSFFEGPQARLAIGTLIFLGSIIVVILLYRFIIKKLTARARRSKGVMDDFAMEVMRLPLLFLLIWIALRIFMQSVFFDTRFFGTLTHVLQVLLIITVGWILIKLTRVLFFYLERKVEEESDNRFQARGSLTKFSIFERMIVGLIIIIIVAICLMTFDKIRTVGVSLLTSAGIAGVVLGFAAQKSLGMVLAGIQIAITQPIKLNDLLLIDGQSGTVEEINLTYVVVKLWNKKRLIVPVNYFLENKFENWTRASSDLLAEVFIYVDYRMPVEPISKYLDSILADNKDWDKTVGQIEVTQYTDRCMQVRALISSEDNDKSSSLQSYVRRKLIDFMQDNYPQYLVRERIDIASLVTATEKEKRAE